MFRLSFNSCNNDSSLIIRTFLNFMRFSLIQSSFNFIALILNEKRASCV